MSLFFVICLTVAFVQSAASMMMNCNFPPECHSDDVKNKQPELFFIGSHLLTLFKPGLFQPEYYLVH